jgi:hypothetical protein
MKKVFRSLALAALMVGFTGLAGPIFTQPTDSMAEGPGPVVAVGTPLIKLNDYKAIVITGTGFQPGQEIHLLFTTPDGQQADIGYALKPEPQPDQAGSWSTTWNASDFVTTELVTGGTYKLSVVDGDFRVVTHTHVAFESKPEKGEKDKNGK